jgi:hypothetical protein
VSLLFLFFCFHLKERSFISRFDLAWIFSVSLYWYNVAILRWYNFNPLWDYRNIVLFLSLVLHNCSTCFIAKVGFELVFQYLTWGRNDSSWVYILNYVNFTFTLSYHFAHFHFPYYLKYNYRYVFSTWYHYQPYPFIGKDVTLIPIRSTIYFLIVPCNRDIISLHVLYLLIIQDLPIRVRQSYVHVRVSGAYLNCLGVWTLLYAILDTSLIWV